MLWRRIRLYLELVKFPHTLFALPFAFTGALLAERGIPPVRTIFWIAVAMVGARSGAMAFNRWADAILDAVNPRTKNRPIPRGAMGRGQVLIFSLFSYALLVLAAYELNPLCFKLSPIAIVVTSLYSYTKRFTWATHLILGLSLSMAPIGAWIAVKGVMEKEALILAAAVLFWVAGFDILYAMQDMEFDRRFGLYSIPRILGVRNSLYLARGFHCIALFLLLLLKILLGLGTLYTLGWIIVLLLLLHEHRLVTPEDLSRLDVAFFNMNGYISLTVFIFTLLDLLL